MVDPPMLFFDGEEFDGAVLPPRLAATFALALLAPVDAGTSAGAGGMPTGLTVTSVP